MPTAPHRAKPSRPERHFAALLLSLLAHALLAVGFWYVSQGHDVEDLSHVQVTMVTPDMLAKMQADAKANTEDTALSYKESLKNKASRGEAEGVLVPPKANDAPIEKPKPKPKPAQKQTAIFAPEPATKPVFEQQFDEPEPKPKFQPKAKSKPEPKPKVEQNKAKPKLKPKTGEPDPDAKQKTSDWAKQQEKIIEEKKRKERKERAEKEKLRKQQAAEKKAKERDAQKARDAKKREEQKRLNELKKAEQNKDEELAKRREAIKKAKEDNEKRLKAQAKKHAVQDKKQSLAESSKALGIADAAADEFGSAGKSAKDDKAKAARDKETADSYRNKIGAKIKRNWTKETSLNIKIPVKINLSDSGSVISVRITKSSGDKALDASLEQAIRNSSPLPVPSDPDLRRKHFRSLTLSFETN